MHTLQKYDIYAYDIYYNKYNDISFNIRYYRKIHVRTKMEGISLT